MGVEEVDIKKELKVITRTGKVIIGFKQSYRAMLNKRAKVVMLADNCPSDLKREIEIASKVTSIPVMDAGINSVELGHSIGKPFAVAVIGIIDAGSSSLLDEIGEKIE